MQTVELRRRVQNGLNKGEASDASEIGDCSFENQYYRAGGLNLFVAAIILWNNHILWNTTYLERVFQVLRDADGLDVRFSRFMSKPQLRSSVSPITRVRALYSSATPEGLRQAKTISWSLLFLN